MRDSELLGTLLKVTQLVCVTKMSATRISLLIFITILHPKELLSTFCNGFPNEITRPRDPRFNDDTTGAQRH